MTKSFQVLCLLRVLTTLLAMAGDLKNSISFQKSLKLLVFHAECNVGDNYLVLKITAHSDLGQTPAKVLCTFSYSMNSFATRKRLDCTVGDKT